MQARNNADLKSFVANAQINEPKQKIDIPESTIANVLLLTIFFTF